VVDIEQAETDRLKEDVDVFFTTLHNCVATLPCEIGLEEDVDVGRRCFDSVECQHRVEIERCRENEPTERYTHQHVRYASLNSTRYSVDTVPATKLFSSVLVCASNE